MGLDSEAEPLVAVVGPPEPDALVSSVEPRYYAHDCGPECGCESSS